MPGWLLLLLIVACGSIREINSFVPELLVPSPDLVFVQEQGHQIEYELWTVRTQMLNVRTGYLGMKIFDTSKTT